MEQTLDLHGEEMMKGKMGGAVSAKTLITGEVVVHQVEQLQRGK